jgi:putative membrane protein
VRKGCLSGGWGFLGDFGGWGGIGLILMGLIWVGLLAGLALLAVWAIRRARVPANTAAYAAGGPAAREILQTQYARGEITREQYQQKRRDIE